jgi:hypothetical protein
MSAVFVGSILAFSFAWGWPAFPQLAAIRMSSGPPGSAIGPVLTGAALGAIEGPIAFGLLAEHLSRQAAWMITGSWLVIAAGILSIVHYRHHWRSGSM